MGRRRAPKQRTHKKTIKKYRCLICEGKKCIDELEPSVVSKINPTRYNGCVTRSMSKILDINNYTIIEAYRCMPLLGDEQEKDPTWDVHIARYCIVFKKIN